MSNATANKRSHASSHNLKHLLIVLAAALILTAVCFGCLRAMSRSLETNTLAQMEELSSHDKRAIQMVLETTWDNLRFIDTRLISYNDSDLSDCMERLRVMQASSNFTDLFLVDSDGNAYSDRGIMYTYEERPILDYVNRSDGAHFGYRYAHRDYSGESRESLLFGIRIHDREIDGHDLIALVGLLDTSTLQNFIVLNSFERDGIYRGYSSVVNLSGDYVVNIRRSSVPAVTDNVYNIIAAGTPEGDLTLDSIKERMQASETFHFNFINADGTARVVYFSPLPDVPWYFLMAVDRDAFDDQSRGIITLVIVMLVSIMVVLLAATLFIIRSRSSRIRVQAAADAKSQFLSNMSHEIRTPLNGIVGIIHLLETHREDWGEGELEKWLAQADETSQYLLSLVSDILDISKLESGDVELVPEPFDWNSLLDRVRDMQQGNAESHGVEIALTRDIRCPLAVGDKMHIEQVLMNIIGNAVKFTPKGGHIYLSAVQSDISHDNATTTVTCSDTGVGMSREFMDHIWDSFSQERNSVSDGTRGTGLGMTICKLLIDKMGGNIDVSSEPGQGSTFTVTLTLPIAAAPAHGDIDPAGHLELHAVQALLSCKVLVAEDNALNAEILCEVLRTYGFEPILATDGEEAVDIFTASSEGEIPVILMDMQMPVLDGCEACERIRAMKRSDAASVRIIACTANTFVADRNRAIEAGMNDFLTKPIDINVLIRMLGQ